MITVTNNIYKQQLSDSDFNELINIVYKICGIRLSQEKRTMAEGRLRKRIKILGFDSYGDYIKHIKEDSNLESEVIELINVISTNKSDFFREPDHFKFLMNKAIPKFIKDKKYENDRTLRIWCAASSTGEEPYTISMVLNRFYNTIEKFDYSIIASDISTRVLNHAFKGVYEIDKINSVDPVIKSAYFLKSKKNKTIVRIVPEIRKSVRFFRQNLMDEKYNIKELQDVIFCRNVLIYFSKEDQEKVINKLAQYLKPEGFLITGHSETLTGMKTGLKRIESTIYQK